MNETRDRKKEENGIEDKWNSETTRMYSQQGTLAHLRL